MTIIRYTKEHEWLRVEEAAGGVIATVGITRHAEQQLGDIVFVELPEPGRALTRGDSAAVVESVKAASDVYAPASGEVVEVNSGLADEPARVNADAEGDGWFFRMRLSDPKELEILMDAEAYQAYLAEIG